MSIEMAAIDALTEEGHMSPEVAIAIAKSIDLSISGANLVTMSVFNERFAELTVKLETRFSQLERSLAAAKVWAVSLYAALVTALFGALAADHHWLVGRQDQLLERMDRRFELMDERFQQMDQRWDERFQQMDQRWDERFQQMNQGWDARFRKIEEHLQTSAKGSSR